MPIKSGATTCFNEKAGARRALVSRTRYATMPQGRAVPEVARPHALWSRALHASGVARPMPPLGGEPYAPRLRVPDLRGGG